jgi:hypothetical protein
MWWPFNDRTTEKILDGVREPLWKVTPPRPCPNPPAANPSATLNIRVAQTDDPAIFQWLTNAHQHGGGFVSSLASAALRADRDNYQLIRPLVLRMQEKYPEYNPR